MMRMRLVVEAEPEISREFLLIEVISTNEVHHKYGVLPTQADVF